MKVLQNAVGLVNTNFNHLNVHVYVQVKNGKENCVTLTLQSQASHKSKSSFLDSLSLQTLWDRLIRLVRRNQAAPRPFYCSEISKLSEILYNLYDKFKA